MNLWSLLLIILLLIGVTGLFVFFGYTTNKNISQSSTAQIYSFAGKIDPTTTLISSYDTPLVGQNSQGQTVNQITCPAGTTINIIGAIADIYDPFGECTINPSPQLRATCDPSVSAGTCSSNSDCYDNTWYCNTSGQCQLKSNLAPAPNQLAPADGCVWGATGNPDYQNACIDPNICLGVGLTSTPPGSNYYCNPANHTNACAARDASAYIAAKCNGQTTCNVSIADFGPTPCNIGLGGSNLDPTMVTYGEDYTTQRANNEPYLGLPLTYGWNGQSYPTDSSNNGTANTPTVNLGYKVHGIYSCIPNNE